jgi:hypothetical protein
MADVAYEPGYSHAYLRCARLPAGRVGLDHGRLTHGDGRSDRQDQCKPFRSCFGAANRLCRMNMAPPYESFLCATCGPELPKRHGPDVPAGRFGPFGAHAPQIGPLLPVRLPPLTTHTESARQRGLLLRPEPQHNTGNAAPLTRRRRGSRGHRVHSRHSVADVCP